MMHNNLWLCNGDEKLLLDIKIAAAIVGFMIFIVILIRKLRDCNSGSGGKGGARNFGLRGPSCDANISVKINL